MSVEVVGDSLVHAKDPIGQDIVRVLARRPDTGQTGYLDYGNPEVEVQMTVTVCDRCKSAGYTLAGVWVHKYSGQASCRRGSPWTYRPQRVTPINMHTTTPASA